MTLFLLPFKVLGVPGKWLLGMVGVFIAACINAIVFRQVFCWCAWNFGWVGIGTGWLAVVTIGSFILTFVAADGK